MLGVYSDQLPKNLRLAIDGVWDTCRTFPMIHWDVNAFGLSSFAELVSIGLFGNIETRWQTTPGNLERIVFPIGNRGLYDIARRALLESFGDDRVEEPESQLGLF